MPNPALYLAWKGAADDDTRLYGTRCTTGLPNFEPQAGFGVEPRCSGKPSMVPLSDRILLACALDYNVEGQHDTLLWGTCQTWPTWNSDTNSTVGGGASSWGPALALWGAGAIAVWNGDGSDTRIWYSLFNQSTQQWAPQQLTNWTGNNQPLQTGSTPAVVNLNGRLLMVWRGEGDNDNLYFALSTDGKNWDGNWSITGGASTIQPSLAVFNGSAVCCFKGGQNDTGIYSTEFDAARNIWSKVVRTGPFGTSHGPSIAVYQRKLFMTWKGVPGDTTIYWSTIEAYGDTWVGQSEINNAGSSVGPGVVVY